MQSTNAKTVSVIFNLLMFLHFGWPVNMFPAKFWHNQTHIWKLTLLNELKIGPPVKLKGCQHSVRRTDYPKDFKSAYSSNTPEAPLHNLLSRNSPGPPGPCVSPGLRIIQSQFLCTL